MSEENPSTSSARPATHPIFDGTYFKIQTRENDILTCICMECRASVKASVNVTSNFLKHTKVCHMCFFIRA